MAKIILDVSLRDKATAGIEQIKTALKGIQVPKTSVANTAQLEKSYANLFNTIKNSKGSYPDDLFKDVAKNVDRHLQRIKEINASYQKNGELTKQERREYSQLKKDLDQLSASFATTRAEAEKLEKTNKLAIPSVDNLRKRYANLLNTIQSTSKYYKKGTFDGIAAEAKGYLDELKSLDKTAPDYAEKVNLLDKNLNKLSADFAETSQSAKNFHGSLQDIISGFLKFQTAAWVVMTAINAIRKVWRSLNETLVETENRIIELQRVLNNEIGDKQLANSLYDLAIKYGQTFDNASQIALNFARTGMSTVDTLKATEAALLALNVAELDATQASDGMIAIMRQFGLEAKDLELIVDKLNKTADNYAVTTSKILAALQRTGSSARNANLDLNETVSIITAISEATGRSGENIGTAVNSLIQFSQKSKSLDVFASLGGDMSKIVENYRHGQGTILDIWRGLSVEIAKRKGGTENILGSLFGDEDWRSLNAELQEALGENYAKVTEIYDTASTFRKNYFIALLNNMETVEKALDTISEAEGYSQKENEKYLKSYQAKLNELKSLWQKLANDAQGLLGVKKTLVDIASGILKIMEWTGGLRTALASLGIVIVALFGDKITKGFQNLIVNLKAIKDGFLGAASAAQVFQSALGLISVVATAVSLVIGVIEKANAKISEANQAKIASWADKEKDASDLEKLSKRYKELTEKISLNADEQKELKEVEASLIEIMGLKQEALKTLKEGTDEYTNAINANIAAQKEQNRIEYDTAKKAAEDELKRLRVNVHNNTFSSNIGSTYFQSRAGLNAYDLLKNAGVNVDKDILGFGAMLSDWDTSLTAEGQYKNYQLLVAAQKAIESRYNQLILNPDNAKETDALLNYYNYLGEAIAQYAPYVNAYEKYRPSFTDWLKGQNQDDKPKVEQESRKTLEDFADKYDEIAKKVREIYNVRKDTLEIEQARLAVMEAEQALLDAQNQRTVRVFNAVTGQWEMQADQKSITDAQKRLDDARKNAEQVMVEQIATTLDDAKTNGIKLSKETILALVSAWKGYIPDGAANAISEAFSTSTSGKVELHDNGGVLHGIGAIKATSRDEITLPPYLAEKILQPVSNAQFKAFAESLGILFGASSNLARLGRGDVVYNSGGNTNNSNNNYTVNGIPITQEQARRPLVEIFEDMCLIPN